MQEFLNRLNKSVKELRRWAARRGVEAYRVYDRDVPGFPFVVDVFGSWAVVASRAREAHLDDELARRTLELAAILGVPEDRIIWRKRMRQRGLAQYEKLSQEPIVDVVSEHGMRFEINLTQYLDVGLFLDHRKTRLLLHNLAQSKSCLNLFCYTGTASVAMAKGGASRVTSMDLSKTYLAWAQRNFSESGCCDPARFEFVHQDVVGWLAEPWRGAGWDLIFVDPPSFSNSKRMDGTFDVQRDHAWMLNRLATRLAPQGILIFSNNRSGFVLDKQVTDLFQVSDITPWSHPRDFRSRAAHRCYVLTKGDSQINDAVVRAIKTLGPDV